MKLTGVGQINFWPGGSLWTGIAQEPTAVHAHHAIQLTFGLQGKVSFRTASDPQWRDYDAVYLPSHLPHAFGASGSTVAVLLCEPESQIGKKLRVRFGTKDLVALPEQEASSICAAIAAAYAAAKSDGELVSTALAALEKLSNQSAATATDKRIEKAIVEISQRLVREISLNEIAQAIHLSPSRFRHLFATEVGMAFRPYIRWKRLQYALECAVGGMSWTEAAHAANFSDSAHLSRTFRKLLGITPVSVDRSNPDAGRKNLRK